jgi:hypothetical protein
MSFAIWLVSGDVQAKGEVHSLLQRFTLSLLFQKKKLQI